MLEKLSPPTDNLYKFLAVFGLVLLLLGVWLFVRDIDGQMNARMEALRAIREVVRAESESQEAMDLLSEAANNIKEGKETYPVYAEARRIDGLSDETMAAFRALEIAGDEAAYLKGRSKWIYWGSIVIAAIGLDLMIGGYWFWYVKVQKLEDAILRQRAEAQASDEVGKTPANAGRPWQTDEDDQLRQGFAEAKSIAQLAKAHKRSNGAIRARLLKLDLIEA